MERLNERDDLRIGLAAMFYGLTTSPNMGEGHNQSEVCEVVLAALAAAFDEQAVIQEAIDIFDLQRTEATPKTKAV